MYTGCVHLILHFICFECLYWCSYIEIFFLYNHWYMLFFFLRKWSYPLNFTLHRGGLLLRAVLFLSIIVPYILNAAAKRVNIRHPCAVILSTERYVPVTRLGSKQYHVLQLCNVIPHYILFQYPEINGGATLALAKQNKNHYMLLCSVKYVWAISAQLKTQKNNMTMKGRKTSLSYRACNTASHLQIRRQLLWTWR